MNASGISIAERAAESAANASGSIESRAKPAGTATEIPPRAPRIASEAGRNLPVPPFKDRGLDRGGADRQGGPGESELEKAAGAKQKSRDFDLGM